MYYRYLVIVPYSLLLFYFVTFIFIDMKNTLTKRNLREEKFIAVYNSNTDPSLKEIKA